MILGCAERGRKSDGPFDHMTGRGWVKEQKGHYYDARCGRDFFLIAVAKVSEFSVCIRVHCERVST